MFVGSAAGRDDDPELLHLPEKHGPGAELFEAMAAQRGHRAGDDRGRGHRGGAPTQNAQSGRDPEMQRTKQGSRRRFGRQARGGRGVGLAHTLTAAAGKPVVGRGGGARAAARDRGRGAATRAAGRRQEENRDADVEMRPGRRRLDRSGPEAAAEQRKASVRAKVEHPFPYGKRRFGYAKVRCRGLAQNTQRTALFGFAKVLIAGRYATAG